MKSKRQVVAKKKTFFRKNLDLILVLLIMTPLYYAYILTQPVSPFLPREQPYAPFERHYHVGWRFPFLTSYFLMVPENYQPEKYTYVWAQTQGERTDAMSHLEDQIIEIDCYEDNLKTVINFKINFFKKEVLSPPDLVWGRLKSLRNSEKGLTLWNPQNEQQGFYELNLNTGSMQVCKHDYVSARCPEYQCYRKAYPLSAALGRETAKNAPKPGPDHNDLVDLSCYEKELETRINLKIDLLNMKVVEPRNVFWHRVVTFKNSDEVRLLLEDRTKDPAEIVEINNLTGEMQSCYTAYVGGHCDLFQCYESKTPLFK